MANIRVLDDLLANKIAAGEVVERPLSVVKELLENSLDAGADFIEIEIRDGGTSLIRVKDNGKGMDADDLKLAFQRHATSKIWEFQDLYRLTTFGFRGEALPSVAAVAQVEMISCSKEEPIGHKICINGGTVQDFSEAVTAPGTVIEVKNLFYNIPARRKFLKSNSYEAGLIGDLISKYAIGYPNIRFRYVSNGQMQLDTAGLTTAEERIAYVYGSNLKSLVITVGKTEVGTNHYAEAFLVREEITRNTRGQEVFFVNGRLVKSAELSAIVEESYYTLIAKGRFPIAVLKLTLPGSELDVNIHPAKTEIKINGYEQLKPKLVELLKDALWEANITKNAFLPDHVAPAAPRNETGDSHSKQVSYAAAGQNKKSAENREAVPKAQWSDIVAEPEKLLQWKPEAVSHKKEEQSSCAQQDSLFDGMQPEKKNGFVQTMEQSAMEQLDCVISSHDLQKKEREGKETVEQPAQAIQLKGIENLSVIGQLNNAFILAQNEEGLYIIDQHTCHERILYEKFMKAEAKKELLSQPLLIPVTVHVSAQQDSILMQHIFTLRELGFVLENFGDRCYLLRSLPFGLQNLSNIEEFFIDLLHDLENLKEVNAAVIKEKLLIMASCKGAVKANWPLNEIEMQTLLHDLSKVENAHTCPHGRPIIYKITMQELYKIFKRGTYHGALGNHHQ